MRQTSSLSTPERGNRLMLLYRVIMQRRLQMTKACQATPRWEEIQRTGLTNGQSHNLQRSFFRNASWTSLWIRRTTMGLTHLPKEPTSDEQPCQMVRKALIKFNQQSIEKTEQFLLTTWTPGLLQQLFKTGTSLKLTRGTNNWLERTTCDKQNTTLE